MKELGRRGAFDLLHIYPLFRVWQLQAAPQVCVSSSVLRGRVKAASIGDQDFQDMAGRFAALFICEDRTLFKTWSIVAR